VPLIALLCTVARSAAIDRLSKTLHSLLEHTKAILVFTENCCNRKVAVHLSNDAINTPA